MSDIKGWQRIRLGDTGAWLSGGTPDTSEPRFWGGDIPWISAASLKNFNLRDSDRRITRVGSLAGTRIVPEGAVLFVVRGMSLKTELRVGVAHRELAFGQDCKAIIPRPGIDGKFLGLAIKSRSHKILGMVDEAGHGTGRLPTDLIHQLSISVPPLHDQRRIVDILDSLDAQVSSVNAKLGKTLQIKQGMLDQLSNRSFSDDKLVKVSDIAKLITSGSRGWSQYYASTGALFIRIGNLTREHINLRFDDRVYVQPSRGSEGARTALLPGDILVSITADLGIIGIVPTGLGEAYVNQHVSMIRPEPYVNSRWIGHMLASVHGQRQFVLANDAGAKAGLNLPAVGRINVPLSSRDKQDQVARTLDEQDVVIGKYRAEVGKLRSLKRGLMEDLLVGRV